jgi:apolipoprotein N-acyltransferase
LTRSSLALSALSGLLLAASFPSLGYSFLAWFALVPLLFALRDQTVRTGLWLSGGVGFVYFCCTVYWVTNSVSVYGHVPLLPASLVTLFLCVILALFIVPFGGSLVHIRATHPRLLLLAAPALWVTLEYARTHLFSGFPWALLGYSQYRSLPVIQIADLFGVYGISFLIVLVNVSIAEALADRKRYLSLAIAAAVMTVVLGYGYARLNEPEGAERIRIAVVQGNIDQDKKWDPSYQREVIATYKRLSLKALEQRPDLVVWPETATPFYFGGSGDNVKWTDDLRQFVRTMNTPLLFGSATYEVKPGKVIDLRNSAILLDRDGAVSAVYHKMHLVPYGEYIPMKKVLFFVQKLVQANGDFEVGNEYTVMGVRSTAAGRNIPLSTVICYEIIFPDLVRRFVDDGATVMTNITNDAWFGRSGAPYQHFAMAVFRAVENHVPLARAANTGVSGFIDKYGRVLAKSPIFTEAMLVHDLVPGTGKTFYTRHGDVFAWLCTIASLLLLAAPLRRTGRPGAQNRKPA